MSHLPKPVINYLQRLIVEDRSPAYFSVRKDGCLSGWGGQLSLYGFTNLKQGESVERQVLFLAGFLPFKSLPTILPCVKMESGVAADVHIFAADEGTWVLLLDARWYESQYSIVQQQRNDLSLIRQYQSRFLRQHLHPQIAANLSEDLLQLLEKGDRRNVTILLAKICGFNSFIADNSPEEVFSTLNSYVAAIVQPLLDEGGMVNKVMGDTVTSLFGILPVNGVPPVHAIKAALRVVDAVREVSKIRQTDNRTTFDSSISIVSGSLILGMTGSQNQKTFIAAGDRMALAEQLGYQASPGEIIVDENTFNHLGEMQHLFVKSHTLDKEVIEPIRIFTFLVA